MANVGDTSEEGHRPATNSAVDNGVVVVVDTQVGGARNHQKMIPKHIALVRDPFDTI